MRAAVITSVSVILLAGCGLEGPTGMFVQLYGRVLTEHGEPAVGAEVSLASSEGAAILETGTDARGWYNAAVLATELEDHELILQVQAEGFATSLAWVDLSLSQGELLPMPSHPPQLWSAWARQLPPMRVAVQEPSGHAEGQLLDAATGDAPMEAVGDELVPLQLDVELREGWNAPDSEPVVKTVTTGQGSLLGRFVVGGIPAGLYTARVLGDGGFTTARFPLLVRGESEAEVRAAVSKDLASDEIRVALVWGESPADLNLHVTGPRASVSTGEAQWERFHVWEGEPVHPPSATDAEDWVVTMDLVADDAPGVESLTVHETRREGEYRFSVYDHSNGGSTGSDALSYSEGLLQLWIGAGEPLFFEITPGLDGTLWTASIWDAGAGRLYRYQDLDFSSDEYDAGSF